MVRAVQFHGRPHARQGDRAVRRVRHPDRQRLPGVRLQARGAHRALLLKHRRAAIIASMKLMLLAASMLLAGSAAAAEGDAPARERAELKVANRTVIVLRGPIAGYHAQERASAATERIGATLDAEPRAAEIGRAHV